MSDKPTIKCMPDGPYLLDAGGQEKGLLKNSRGQEIVMQEMAALCRCGGSGTKPFCDGTHTKNGFDSAKRASGRLDKRTSYEGSEITVHDNRSVCIHIEYCVKGAPGMFDRTRMPWVDPDGDPVGVATSTIDRCPSGALSYSRSGIEHRDHDVPPGVSVTKDGPYHITGGVVLEGEPFAQGVSREHYTLCRCGQSRNKPFCDAKHLISDFTDDKN